MGWYAEIDKKLGGVLPGGVPISKPSTPVYIPPTKSTIVDKQPTAPTMNVTLPSGATITPTPAVTSPSMGGGGYIPPSSGGGSSGGGYVAPTPSGYIGQPISQRTSTKEEITQKLMSSQKETFKDYIKEPQTITRQMQFSTEKAITPLKDYGYVKPYTQSFIQSFKESGTNLIKGNFGDVFTPFGKSGTAINLLSPNLGIESVAYAIKKKTPFDVKRDITKAVIKSTGNEYFNYPEGPIRQSKIAEDIGISIYRKTSEDYNKMFIDLQQQVDTGLDISSAEKILSSYEDILQEKAQQKFKSEFDIKLAELSEGQKIINRQTRGLTSTGKIVEIGGPLAVDIGVMTLIPGGAGLKLIGAKDIIIGGKEQDILKVGSGSLFLGGSTLSSINKIPYEVSTLKATRELGTKGFKFGEIQFQGLNKDVSLVKGFREAEGLRQEITIAGNIYKEGEGFIQPGSRYALSTGGIIKNEYANLGRKDIIFIGGQTGQIGTKGFALPIGEAGDFTATFGRGTLVKEFETSAYGKLGISKESLTKQFKYNVQKFDNEFTSDYFMGVTKELGKDTFVTRSGKISSMELNPTREIEISNKVFNKDMITLYHTTPSKNIPSILEKGLIPGKASGIHGVIGDSDKVFTAISRQTAEGYKVMGEGREILNIQIPKKMFFEQVKKEGVGTIGQVKFDFIPTKYIEGSKDFGTGFSKIEKSVIKQTREGLLIKTNLKDFTITKIIKQPKFETTFDISTSNKGTDLALKQLAKQQTKSSKGFLTTSTVQQFKTELVPMIKSPTKSFSSQALSGLKLEGVKSSNKFATQLTKLDTRQKEFGQFNTFSSSLQKSDSMFKTSNLPKTTLATLPGQDQLQPGRLATMQLSGLKEIELSKEMFRTPAPFTTFSPGFKISPPGFSGLPFFGALPSLGDGGVSTRRKKKKKKVKTKIAPSFTAGVFDLRGPLPKSGKFGITPFQLRRIPKGGRNYFNIKI